MYSGKTTVGELVASVTGREFIDTDRLIESEQGTSVSDIFEAKGEDGFRALEREVVQRTASREGLVMALGGGAVLDARNVDDARSNGVVYYLRTTPAAVVSRAAGAGGRPLLEGRGAADIEELMKSREKSYLGAAHAVIDSVECDPGEVADEIIADFAERAKGQGK